ncbi:RHS repeat-associated core domain-containing protein [Pseudomonas sp. RC3H12]|uniref:RHS repeat-associated core domain-containing protein n=1 Tax=Pseudomonas sp. RC3H12 TaxID=2834406 RepID=UPI001BDEF53C|nr:RHS repeat-associated core domain-containing protein [Pseudomonas sp. RC3H12]QWA28886.1 RHS repeat-associated core domain-containing protein [Pseudomonas sp. RC3H12]
MTQDHKASSATTLLATDAPGSVLRQLSSHLNYNYTPFGYDAPRANGGPLLGFNSQLLDLSCTYLLGSGYRAYNPTTMRFNSPDSLSPFNGGGINIYAYCSNDPINNVDPSGHIQRPLLQTNATYKAHHGILYKAMPFNGKHRMVQAPPGSMNILEAGITKSQAVLEILNQEASTLKRLAQPELGIILTSQQIIVKNNNTLAQLPIPARGARDRDNVKKVHQRLDASSALEQGRINVAMNSKKQFLTSLKRVEDEIAIIKNDIYITLKTMDATRTKK